MTSYIAYIGVGANLGDAIQQIVDARKALERLSEITSVRSSLLYSSTPIGYDNQPDFINAVFEVVTIAQAHTLFRYMQNIETSLGRQRDPNNQNAPRTIDLDLLLFADQVIDDEHLTVPHPRMAQRLFVLQPLAELAPDLAFVQNATPDLVDQELHPLIV